MFSQIVFHQQETAVFRGRDPLHGLTIQEDKSGAQYLMPDKNALQSLAQNCRVQISLQAHTDRNVVSLAAAFDLRQKPKPLLGKRDRQPLKKLDARRVNLRV